MALLVGTNQSRFLISPKSIEANQRMKIKLTDYQSNGYTDNSPKGTNVLKDKYPKGTNVLKNKPPKGTNVLRDKHPKETIVLKDKRKNGTFVK